MAQNETLVEFTEAMVELIILISLVFVVFITMAGHR